MEIPSAGTDDLSGFSEMIASTSVGPNTYLPGSYRRSEQPRANAATVTPARIRIMVFEPGCEPNT
jgi:hypothetical protein